MQNKTVLFVSEYLRVRKLGVKYRQHERLAYPRSAQEGIGKITRRTHYVR